MNVFHAHQCTTQVAWRCLFRHFPDFLKVFLLEQFLVKDDAWSHGQPPTLLESPACMPHTSYGKHGQTDLSRGLGGVNIDLGMV